VNANHRLLRASAGTGKTYRLVEAYVDLVQNDGLRPTEIVAITFTRKAAGELKSRIRARLKAAHVEPDLLADLTQAPIGNFHGLSLRLLRNLVPEYAALNSDAVLGESGDDGELFVEACETAWFGQDSATAAAVCAVAPHLNLDQSLPWELWDCLSKAREDGMPIVGAALLPMPEWREAWERHHEALVAMRARLRAALPDLTEKGRATVVAFLEQPVPALTAAPEVWADAWRRATQGLNRRGKLGALISEADAERFRDGLLDPVAGAVVARLTPSLATLVDAAYADYERAKRSLGCMDFVDLIEVLVQRLRCERGLHQRVRERFRAVLVDEAQDTNRLQRQWVRLLAGLEGPWSEGALARLFVVGDRKQSIYTFRGADPAAFTQFLDDIRIAGGDEELLTVSRRSAPELVASLNGLGTTLFGESYEPLEANRDAVCAQAPLGRPGFTLMRVPKLEAGGMAQTLLEAQAVAEWIASEVRQGTPAGDFALLFAATTRAPLYARALAARGIPSVMAGGGEFYRRSEIIDLLALLAWLVDAQDRLAAAIALRSPLFGFSESLLITLLTSDSRGADLLGGLRRGSWTVEAGIGQEDEVLLRRAVVLLPELVTAIACGTPYGALERVVTLTDHAAVLLGLEDGEQRLANLDRLLALAAAVPPGTSLRAFVRQQWQRVNRGQPEAMAAVPAEGRRAVVMGSVHQSKGLQFPVVVLADLRRTSQSDTGAVRYARGAGLVFRPSLHGRPLSTEPWRHAVEVSSVEREQELRRLFYVAVTRAEREVRFFGTFEASESKVGFGGHLDRFRAAPEYQSLFTIVAAPTAVPSIPTAQPLEATEAERAQAALWVAQATQSLAHAAARVRLPVTTLERYLTCPRRGFFVHDLRLQEQGTVIGDWEAAEPEPLPLLGPRARGRLVHAVLASIEQAPNHPTLAAFVADALRQQGYDPEHSELSQLVRDLLRFLESDTGRLILATPVAERRVELPFLLQLRDANGSVLLDGQMDLLFVAGGVVHLLDYKHAYASTAGAGQYRLQLSLYALAAERLCQTTGDIRVGLAFLRDHREVAWEVVSAAQRKACEAELLAVSRTIAQGRWQNAAWPGWAAAKCTTLGCGFVARCHPSADVGLGRPAMQGRKLEG